MTRIGQRHLRVALATTFLLACSSSLDFDALSVELPDDAANDGTCPPDTSEGGRSDVVYLSECMTGNSQASSEREMEYYSRYVCSKGGQPPESRTHSVETNSESWQGMIVGKFADTDFVAMIDNHDAAVGEVAGAGENGYHAKFICYSSRDRLLYAEDSRACRCIYYCLPRDADTGTR